MRFRTLTGVLAVLLVSGTAYAQNNPTMDNIRLFQSFFEDAHVTPELYLDGEFAYSYYDDVGIPGNDLDLFSLGLRAGFPITRNTEFHTRIGMVHLDPDNGSETGISDLYLGGRHMIYDQDTRVTAGGFLTLPTGKEKTGQDNFDTGIYGALRHPLTNEVLLTGTVGVLYTEKYNRDHEATLRLGGGAIYRHTDKLHFVGEAVMENRYDYMLISGGVDYAIDRKSSLRGSLGFGVDDGAPDVALTLSYFFMF